MVHSLHPAATALAIFVALVVAALLGSAMRQMLPQHHLSAETKDAVQIGMASVATMAALVLGLLVASTKEVYDAEKSELIQMAARIIQLDQSLVNYGKDAAECRGVLREAVRSALLRIWPETKLPADAVEATNWWGQALPQAIQSLSPQNESQHAFKRQAAKIANKLLLLRWLVAEHKESSISIPLLTIMSFWFALTFLSGGMFAPRNATVLAAQFMAAFSVAGAIFLILELDRPFTGFVRISNGPMLNALMHIEGKRPQ